jgi:hypothetical protein
MDASETLPQEWPNQRLKILIPCWVLLIISTFFVVWRVVYGIMQSRRFLLCDYLLIIATVSCHETLVLHKKLIISGAQHHCDFYLASRGRRWTGQTHHGSNSLSWDHDILLLSLDYASSQHHRGCVPQMVHLRLASGTQLLEGLPSHCMAVYSHGHRFQLPGASIDTFWVLTI